MSRPHIVIFCICFCLIAMQIIYIQISSDLDLLDAKYGQLQLSIMREKNEQMELKEELYSLESYTTIATEAASLGFIQGSHYIYLGGN